MVTHKGTPEEILTGIANDLRPEVDRLVHEIGIEKVHKNIESSLARLRERKFGADAVRFDFRNSTPDEARLAIKDGLLREPTATRKVYAALANKTWLLLRGEYTDEIRDWHVLINATRAFVRERDEAVVERLTALADLLGESVAQFEIHGSAASVDRSPQGGDRGTGRHAKHESAVPSEASTDAPPSAPSLQTPQGGDS